LGGPAHNLTLAAPVLFADPRRIDHGNNLRTARISLKRGRYSDFTHRTIVGHPLQWLSHVHSPRHGPQIAQPTRCAADHPASERSKMRCDERGACLSFARAGDYSVERRLAARAFRSNAPTSARLDTCGQPTDGVARSSRRPAEVFLVRVSSNLRRADDCASVGGAPVQHALSRPHSAPEPSGPRACGARLVHPPQVSGPRIGRRSPRRTGIRPRPQRA
jgi:hypothetical protein